MRRVSPAALLIAAAACGHPPPKPPPPAEKPITSVADVAGSWVMDDDLGWFYSLSIDDKGAFVQTIERGRLKTCEQKGTLATGESPKQYTLSYAKNTCSDELAQGAIVKVDVASFTGKTLDLVFAFETGKERRAYHRDPKVPHQ